MPKRYAKRYSRKSRKPSRKPSRKFYGVSKRVKSYVKKAIHSNIENKSKVTYLANQPVLTAETGVVPFSINCIPPVAQGNEQGERVGNVIKPVANWIRGFVNLKPHNELTNPYMPIKVKMWLCSYKILNRNAATLNAADFDRFFEEGNNTVPFQGNMLDMLLPVNKMDWTVYETRTINLGSTSTSTAFTSAGFVYDNSRFSVPFSFNVQKHLKTKLTYDDLSSSRPTNRNMYVIVQAVSAEGSSGGSLYTTCEVHYSHHFEFEDA